MRVTVGIPTHNPKPSVLEKTIQGLKAQSLRPDEWDLVIVNNSSTTPNTASLLQESIEWHPTGRVVEEPELGLTQARLRLFKENENPLVVMVDDDNVLDSEYLSNAVEIAKGDTHLGAYGGKTEALYLTNPPPWIREFEKLLAVRDLGDEVIISQTFNAATKVLEYPEESPIGAGMILRSDAAQAYVDFMEKEENSYISDRRGEELASSGDNEIVLCLLKAGWKVAYQPQLTLRHIIPSERLERAYLSRLARQMHRSWMAVLEKHGVKRPRKIPSPLLLPLKIRSYIRLRAWTSDTKYIQWSSQCGQYEGRATFK